MSSRAPRRGRGRGRPPPRARKPQPTINRAPPLEIKENTEVTVVNGDRSSLTWKRYRLQSIDEESRMCTVIGADGKTRQFPRAVVKPRDWISKLREFFSILGSDKEHPYEFYSFSVAMELLGAPYSDLQCMKVFQTLDVRANGVLDFQHFLNWMYGLGRHSDRAKLLTTVECICGIRDWEQDRKLKEQENSKGLPFYTFEKRKVDGKISQTDDQNYKIDWQLSCINWEKSTDGDICLVPMSSYNNADGGRTNNAALDVVVSNSKNDVEEDGKDNDEKKSQVMESRSGEVRIVRTLDDFKERFNTRLYAKKQDWDILFRPVFPNDQNVVSVIVMGPGESGKSAMLNKFVKGVFPHEYDPTITDHFRKSFVVDEESCVLEITDTAGQEEFASMRYEWLRDGVDVLIVAFTRASKLTFIQWKEQIAIAQRMLTDVVWNGNENEWRIQPRKVPIIAVGTKADLYQDECEVSRDELDQAIDELGGVSFIQYVECSAYLDEGDDYRVDQPFEAAVKAYRESRKGKRPEKVSREESFLQRRDSLAKEQEKTKMDVIRGAMMNVLFHCLGACPMLQKYVQIDEPLGKRLLVIGRVPKDRFPDDVAHPVFSVRHFVIARNFSVKKFLAGVLMSILFPIFLTLQTLVFVFYNEGCGCNKLVRKLPEWDYNDPSVQILFDFLSPIVGRDPRDEAVREDSRLWFVSQTVKQKLIRLLIAPFIVGLFFFAFFNAFSWTFQGTWKSLVDGNDENDIGESKIAVVEIMGPVVLWELTWCIIAFFMALDIDIAPQVPSLQELRPFVLYLGEDESIRTTAYVFLRGFAKSTLQMLRLEATWGRIVVAALIGVLYSLIPGVTRAVTDQGFFTYSDYRTEAMAALITNLLLTFVLALALQMQLFSGLQNYVEWMDDVTSLLDNDFAQSKDLPYLSMVRQSNAIGWVEMRTYLYTKGLIIFSRQEIFVSSMLALNMFLAVYLLYRLLTDTKVYQSESVNAVFFMFLVLSYSLLRLLSTVQKVERIQEKQEALLSNQKLKVYYRRITYHPTNESEKSNRKSKDNNNTRVKQDTMDELADVTNVPFNDSDNESGDGGISGVATGIKTVANEFGSALAGALGDLMSTTGTTNMFKSNNGENTINQEMSNGGIALLSVQNEEYLQNTETLLSDIRSLVHSQDIIPRVCNTELRKIIGLSVLAALFAVIPTTLKALQDS